MDSKLSVLYVGKGVDTVSRRLKHHIVTFVLNRKEIEPSVLYCYMFCGFNIFATEIVTKIVTTNFQICHESLQIFRMIFPKTILRGDIKWY